MSSASVGAVVPIPTYPVVLETYNAVEETWKSPTTCNVVDGEIVPIPIRVELAKMVEVPVSAEPLPQNGKYPAVTAVLVVTVPLPPVEVLYAFPLASTNLP
jgi:hypothetical protein